MGATEDWLSSMRGKTAARVGTALSHDQQQPEAAAKAHRLGGELGVPSSVVSSAPEVFARQADQKRATDTLADAPLTAQWLTDRQNGALAKDDLDNLTWFERQLRPFASLGAPDGPYSAVYGVGSGAARGFRRTTAIPPQMRAQKSAQVLADFGKSLDDLIAEELAQAGGENAPASLRVPAMQAAQLRFDAAKGLSEAQRAELLSRGAEELQSARDILDRASAIQMSPGASEFRDNALAKADNTFLGALRAFASDWQGGAAFIAETAAEALPQMVAAAGVTAATRSPAAGAFAMGAGSALTENATSAMEFLSEQGVDLSTPEAAAAVLENAELMQAAADRGLTRGLIIGLMDALSGGVAGQKLMESPVGDVVAQGLSQVAFGAAGEGVAQYAAGQEISWIDIVIEGLAELVTAPVEVLGIGGRGFLRRLQSMSDRSAVAGTLSEIDEMAAASKLRDRAPDKFAEALEAQGLGEVYVPADKLREFFQAKDMTGEEWGFDVSALEEQALAAVNVPLPMATYATRISGTEDAAWVRDNAVLQPGELSSAEAQAANEEVQEILAQLQEEAEAAQAADAELRAADQQIYDDVFSQLRSAGRSPEVAKNESAVHSAFWRTMQERFGEDALNLARSMGLRIQGQLSDQGRRRGALDISLNTLRSQGEKALRPRGTSVLDFVKAQGGVRDTGGDVEALDAPKGLIAESAAEVAERRAQPSLAGLPTEGKGRGLDELGRAMIEAGYFPEMNGATDVDEAAVALGAIQRAISGENIYPIGEGVDPELSALAEALSAAGVDLSAATNDEAAAALEEGQGRELFQQEPALRKDIEIWRGKLADYLRGKLKPGADLRVGRVPDVLRSLGVKKGQMVFRAGKVGKVIKDHPDIGVQSLTDLPQLIADPDLVYREEGKQSDLIVVTSRRTSSGAPVVVAIKTDGVSNKQSATVVLTVYPLDGGNKKIASVRSKIAYVRDDMTAAGYELTGANSLKGLQSQPSGQRSASKVLTAEDVFKGREFKQGAKRGSIVFPSGGLTSGETVINLFEQANLSTFLHESGHYFLEAFNTLASDENAPQAMQEDMAAIRKFLGNDGSAFTTEQHEKWARASEAYFMEGKAPSMALGDAFARFKAWLTRIYRSLSGLNVKVTSEIREVMDRMLATDAEIDEARAEAAMSPLFKEAPAGMGKTDFEAYKRMARRSTEQAEQRLLEKTMAKVRREREAWFKAEKKAVRDEVEASMNKQPVYRLVEALANGRWFGSDQDVPDMRMDRNALVEMFGQGVLKEIDRQRVGGKRAIYKDGGDPPQDVARFFGFPSATEMVQALQNAGKRTDAITAEVDRVMDERHGDPLNDGSIEAEALAAIHNEQQANTVAAEVRQLARQMGRSQGNLNARVFRQRARAMLGRMTVKEAAKPHNFLAAERRASREAEKAFARIARGNGEAALSAAYQAKEQQLLNHMLYEESRAFEQQLQRGREKMRSYSKASVREKLDGGYIEQIDALLERFDFRKRAPGQIARTESLSAYVDRMIEAGREAELLIDPSLMDEARRLHYTRLSVGELRGLFDTIQNIDHMGRFKQKLIDAKRKRDLAESVSRVVGAVNSSQPPSEDRQSSMMFKALNLIRKPDTILVALDGGDEMGPVYDELKRGIDEGQAQEQLLQVKMAEQFEALFSEHYSRKELRSMVEPKAVPGAPKREWSKQEILALALNTGAAENHQRVMDQNVDPEMKMDQASLKALLGTLDENDWRFVQGMWDMVNTYWPDLAAVHKRRTGVEPRKVEPRLMYDGAPAFVKGGYYPIKYDPTRGKNAARDEASAWDKFLTAGHGSTAAVRNGMTKQRQQSGGGRTLKYDLTVPFQHLRETVRYVVMSEAVDNAYRVLNHEETVQAMQATGNEDTLKTLNLWLKDTAQGPVFNTDPLNTGARMVKNNFTLSRLAFNLKTVILQATGLGQSAATIGKKNMIRGMVDYMKRPAELIAEVTQKSPFMAERQTTFQKDIYDFANDVKVQSPLAGRWSRSKNAVAKVGFWPMIKMQFLVVDMPTWLGAYRAGLERYKGDDQKASHYADRMVARAQDSGMFGDRAAVERGTVSENVRQADFIRLFTTLGGYMLTKLNRAQVTAIQARAGIQSADSATGKAAVAFGAATDIMLLMAFEPLLMALLYSAFTDDDEPEDMAEFIAAEMGMAIVGGIPIVRDMASAVRGYGGGGIYGSVLEMPYRAGVQVAQGENDKSLRRSIGDIIGTLTGLPSTATLRLYEGMLREDDTPLSEAFFGTNPLAE